MLFIDHLQAKPRKNCQRHKSVAFGCGGRRGVRLRAHTRIHAQMPNRWYRNKSGHETKVTKFLAPKRTTTTNVSKVKINRIQWRCIRSVRFALRRVECENVTAAITVSAQQSNRNQTPTALKVSAIECELHFQPINQIHQVGGNLAEQQRRHGDARCETWARKATKQWRA